MMYDVLFDLLIFLHMTYGVGMVFISRDYY